MTQKGGLLGCCALGKPVIEVRICLEDRFLRGTAAIPTSPVESTPVLAAVRSWALGINQQ
jgi:hypothetical protein